MVPGHAAGKDDSSPRLWIRDQHRHASAGDHNNNCHNNGNNDNMIDTLLQVILSQVSPSHLASLPALRDVLELCLKRKPALRPTASKLIEIDKQM